MAFLHHLSDEEQSIKLAKQERLTADLQEQVQQKLEAKRIYEQKKLEEDNKEYELEMASRGLEAKNQKGRGRVKNSASPLRENKNKNNSSINFSPNVPPQHKSYGRPKPFLATLNELHGGPVALKETEKERQRDILCGQLAGELKQGRLCCVVVVVFVYC